MYPVRLGYDTAVNRIQSLSNNGHHAEALLTSVFTVEKTLKRTLKALLVFRGFPSKHAEKIVGRYTFNQIKNAWECFDIGHRTLHEIIGNDKWQYLPKAVEMRNKLVHGQRVYNLEKCKARTEKVLEALKKMQEVFSDEYNYDGWNRIPVRRKSELIWEDPRNGT